jgi:hypothetical protein
MILRSQFKRLATKIIIVHQCCHLTREGSGSRKLRGPAAIIIFQPAGLGAPKQCLEQEDQYRFAGVVIFAHDLFIFCLPSLVSEIDKDFFHGSASFANSNCLTGKGQTDFIVFL